MIDYCYNTVSSVINAFEKNVKFSLKVLEVKELKQGYCTGISSKTYPFISVLAYLIHFNASR